MDAYNERECTNYDAKTFFTEKYFPLFFDSNKYMQWVQNSSMEHKHCLFQYAFL